MRRSCVLLVAGIWCFGMLCIPVMAAQRTVDLAGISWLELSGKHFVVLYQRSEDKDVAKQTLKAAERYYDQLAEDLGFTRRSDFWTWDNRAKIVIFSSQQEFMNNTGAPSWALGYADRDHYLTESRLIVTYRQEEDFFDGLLPHEIGHLVIQDFVPHEYMPIWFEEGIAQMGERRRPDIADAYMRALLAKGQYIPLEFLSRWDIRQETDEKKVEVFYAQSVSVIMFLRAQYGASGFKRLCRSIRDGFDMNESIRRGYPGRLDSLTELEEEWVAALSRP